MQAATCCNCNEQQVASSRHQAAGTKQQALKLKLKLKLNIEQSDIKPLWSKHHGGM
jgi:hypothetical protein